MLGFLKNIKVSNTYNTESNNFKKKLQMPIECYLAILTLLYPLLICKFKFFSITLQTNLFLITSLAILYLHIKQQHNTVLLKSRIKFFDYFTLITFAYNFILMIIKIIQSDIFYEPSIIIMSLCIMHIILSRTGKFHRRYLYYLVASAIFPLCAVLFHYFINAEKTYFIEMIIKDPPVTAAYALMVLTAATLLYCTEKVKELRIYCGVIVGITSLVLFLQQNIIGTCIGGLLFIIIPLVFTPTAELIKSNVQMTFLYFFMLSNMPLLTNYSKLLKIPVAYDLTTSIYIDLLIAIAGVFFFQYWEKLPEDIDLSEILLYKVKKAYRFILSIVLLTFFMLAFAGNTIAELPEFMGQTELVGFTKALQVGYWYQQGSLYAALKEFGVLGAAFLIVLFAQIMVRVKRNYDRKKTISSTLTIIAIMFLVEAVFFKPSTLVTPIYFIFIIFAVYHKKKRAVVEENNEEKEEEENEEYNTMELDKNEESLIMLDLDN